MSHPYGWPLREVRRVGARWTSVHRNNLSNKEKINKTNVSNTTIGTNQSDTTFQTGTSDGLQACQSVAGQSCESRRCHPICFTTKLDAVPCTLQALVLETPLHTYINGISTKMMLSACRFCSLLPCHSVLLKKMMPQP